MADITPDFNLCLQAKGAQPVVKKDFDLDKINSFLHEAYSIVHNIHFQQQDILLI